MVSPSRALDPFADQESRNQDGNGIHRHELLKCQKDLFGCHGVTHENPLFHGSEEIGLRSKSLASFSTTFVGSFLSGDSDHFEPKNCFKWATNSGFLFASRVLFGNASTSSW